MEKNGSNIGKYILPIIIAVILVVAVVVVVVFSGSEEDEDGENERPIAVAGGDVYAGMDALVILDASNSSDPDGDDLEYFWDLDATVDSDNDGDMTNDHDLTGITVTHTFEAASAGDVIVVTLMVNDGEYEAVDTIQITIEDEEGEQPPDVFMTVTYGVPVGLIADPHYIITVDEVSSLEPISAFTYEIRDDEDEIVISDDLDELLTAGINETVRYIDLTTSTEGLNNVSEGDTILVRDIAPIEEGYTFHLKYLAMTEDAGMVTLLKDLVP